MNKIRPENLPFDNSQNLTVNSSFWEDFKLIKSKGDGHCFMYSLEVAINALPFCKACLTHYSKDKLLNKLKHEFMHNITEYLPYTDEYPAKNLYRGMMDYVNKKLYDSSFGDLVPIVMSNALKLFIIIVECEASSGNLRIIPVGEKFKCYGDCVLIFKNGHHYDGLISKQCFNLPNSPTMRQLVESEQPNVYNSSCEPVQMKKKHYPTSKRPTSTLKLSIVGLNINGLASKVSLGILEKFLDNFDIACLSETKINDIDENMLPNFHPYVLERKNKSHKFGGIHGICVLVKKHLVRFISVVSVTSNENVLWFKLDKGAYNYECIIGAIYLPYEGSPFYSSDIFDTLAEDILCLESVYNLPIMIIGDCNARTGTTDDFITLEDSVAANCGLNDVDNLLFDVKSKLENIGITTKRFSEDKKCNNNGLNLIELCKSLNITIVNGRFGKDKGVGKFTCQSHNKGFSTIDYAIASPSMLPYISDFYVDLLDKCLSDCHSPICLTLNFETEAHDTVRSIEHLKTNDLSDIEDVKHKQSAEHLITKWNILMAPDYKSSFDSSAIEHLSNQLDMLQEEHMSQDDVDSLTKSLCDIYINPAIASGIAKYTKSTRGVRHKVKKLNGANPWFNKECLDHRSEYFQFKNNLRKKHIDMPKLELKTKAKAYKKKIMVIRRKFYKDLNKNLRNLKSKNPKEYWNILNKATDINNTQIGKISLDTFMSYFKKLGSKDGEVVNKDLIKNLDPPSNLNKQNEDINRDFTIDEIIAMVKKAKNNKAYGFDNIINEFLKYCPTSVLELTTKLYNVVLKTGIAPISWCIGIIKPLYKKKGSMDNPDNYRGITLLSCLGKLFTSLINCRLTVYLEDLGKIGNEQAGFRGGYSTLDHIFTLSSIIDLYLFKKKRIYCAFVDYKKAFDFVNRTSLWEKVVSEGISGRILTVVYNIYANAKSCVKVQNKLSDLFPCNVGVRQGENLSPLLFAIYLNDFESSLSCKFNGLEELSETAKEHLNTVDVETYLHLFVLLYADDTIILAESPAELQNALDATQEYCDLWDLTVNTSKTKVVIFSRGKVRNKPDFFFRNEKLEITDDYIYLGTTFNYNGKFDKARAKQVAQAKRALYGLRSKAQKLKLPIDLQCELFEQLIEPILLYGSEIWGFNKLDQVEVFYRSFIKQILHLNKSTPNSIVYGEIGSSKLENKIYGRMISFWIRLLEGKQSKLSALMYTLTRKMYDSNVYKSKWLSKIHDILQKCGMSNVWDQVSSLNGKWIENSVKLRLSDINMQNWSQDISSNSKCFNYRIFKKKIVFENYLTDLEPIHRINLCKFRCANAKLPVHTSHFEPNNTCNKCTFCDLKETGDEFHYLFKCTLFAKERAIFLEPCHYIRPNTNKMHALFKSNRSQMVNLAKFIGCILKKFK